MAMNDILIKNHSIELDKEGYLVHLNDWSEELATELASIEGIQLTPEHWEVLVLLREFYAKFQVAPATRPLIKYIAQNLGAEKGSSMHLNKLFKGTPAKLAARLAGLPKPTNCI